MSAFGRRKPAGRPVPPPLDGLVPIPTYRDQPSTPASDVAGVDLNGSPTSVPVLGTGHWTLLLFLKANCDGCRDLWEALADPVAAGLVTDEHVVALTRDPGDDDLGLLRELAPAGARVVMSTDAWRAYRVQGPPFFVLVDGRQPAPDAPQGAEAPRIVTEGVAWGIASIAGYVASARGRS